MGKCDESLRFTEGAEVWILNQLTPKDGNCIALLADAQVIYFDETGNVIPEKEKDEDGYK